VNVYDCIAPGVLTRRQHFKTVAALYQYCELLSSACAISGQNVFSGLAAHVSPDLVHHTIPSLSYPAPLTTILVDNAPVNARSCLAIWVHQLWLLANTFVPLSKIVRGVFPNLCDATILVNAITTCPTAHDGQ
jgi:hypothetical protein